MEIYSFQMGEGFSNFFRLVVGNDHGVYLLHDVWCSAGALKYVSQPLYQISSYK